MELKIARRDTEQLSVQMHFFRCCLDLSVVLGFSFSCSLDSLFAKVRCVFVRASLQSMPSSFLPHTYTYKPNMNMNFESKRTRYRCIVCDEVSACTCINIYGSEIKYWHTYLYTYMCINIMLQIALISIGFLLHSFFLAHLFVRSFA